MSPRRADINRARRAGLEHGRRNPLGCWPVGRPLFTHPLMVRAWRCGVARARTAYWNRVNASLEALLGRFAEAFSAMGRAMVGGYAAGIRPGGRRP